jgi:hypothetical protein
MTSRYNIGVADQLMAGRANDRGLMAMHGGKVGVPLALVTAVALGSPAAAVADLIVKAATGAELPSAAAPGTTLIYTTATDGTTPLDGAAAAPATVRMADGTDALVWDVRQGATYGRNLVAVTTATAVVAMTILLRGYDWLKRPMTEQLAISANGTSKTATGAKAFAYLRAVEVTAAASAADNTLNLGTGVKLGLPYRLHSAADLMAASLGGVQELVNVAANASVVAGVGTAASATTGDVRGTVAFTGTLTGSAEARVTMIAADRMSAAGLAGVVQA